MLGGGGDFDFLVSSGGGGFSTYCICSFCFEGDPVLHNYCKYCKSWVVVMIFQ